MFFAHDPVQHFYYLGNIEPYPRIYHDMLDSATIIAADVETISLKERMAIGISVSPAPDIAFYFPLFPTESPIVPWHLLRNPNVTKVWHNCLPTTCMALTQDGWKSYNTITTDDMVMGYDQDDEQTKWCKIKRVIKPEPMPLVKFGNKRMSFAASPDHRWIGARTKPMPWKYIEEIVTTDEFVRSKYVRLRLSAPCNNNGTLEITPDEARIIAWILTDGHIQWVGNSPNSYISQSKRPELQEIMVLLSGHITNVYPQQPQNTANKNTVYRIHISASYIRGIWEKAKLPKENKSRLLSNELESFVLGLSMESRTAFLNTVILGDGTDNNNNVRIAQSNEARRDCFQLAAFLEGHMPVVRPYGLSLLLPYITGQHIKSEHTEGYGWCLETELGTWVAKDTETGNIFITGNCMFDLQATMEYDIDSTNTMDTSVMSRLLCNKFNGLSDLSHIHQREVHDAGEFLKGYGAKAMLDCPENEVARKCMQDSIATLILYYAMLPNTNLDYMKVEMATIPIMLEMSQRGMLLDQDARAGLELVLQNRVDDYIRMCDDLEGFNPASPQQVSWVLAKRGAYSTFGKLPFVKNQQGRRTSHLSTAKETLEKMDDPLARLVLNYRDAVYPLTHYIRPWAGEERAYCRYHLDAATGRPSSTDRNMQNIPGIKSLLGVNVRGCLLPDTGIFTDFDYNQLELRLLAHLSGDREMIHIYEQPEYLPNGEKNPDGDIHLITANFMGIDRKIAKNVGFGMVYGAADETLAETAHIRSVERAHQLKGMWFNLFPQAGDAIRTWQEEARHGNMIVTTLYGRNIRLPDPEDRGMSHTMNCSINYRIQASAAEILKRSLIFCKDLDLALQVHDELVADGFVDRERLAPLETMFPLRTPIEVNYYQRWQ